jgi:hypothetical protein
MRTIIFILGLLFLLSCKERPLPKESNCIFKLPGKEIFIKTSKHQGAKFTIFFAIDSLSINNSKDSVEFRTGAYPQIIVDTADIYVNSQYRGARIIKVENDRYEFEILTDSIFYSRAKILSMGNNNFNIEVVSDSVFHDTFFENKIHKEPYSFIGIDTKDYSIWINGKMVKEGNIHGGW